MANSNIRSKSTKEKIRKTWLKLVEDNNDQINVKEICKQANINRSTFYSYYFDINDLINEIEDEIDNEIVNMILKEDKQDCDIHADFIRYLSYIKENYKQIHACLITSPNGFIKGKINKAMRQAICNYFPKKANESNNIYSMIIGFYQAGLYQIISKWILNGCKEDIEEIIYVIQSCMNKLVQ